MKKTLDAANRFQVLPTEDGGALVVAWQDLAGSLSAEEAVVLAAWLLATVDPGRKVFDRALKAILEE